MALQMRPRLVPQCPACLRSYAFAISENARASALRQQIRGKKKMPNNSSSITVKLLKDVKAYGRAGSFVPISPGAMRNSWFPSRIAEYVTVPEMRKLRASNIPIERTFDFEPIDVSQRKKLAAEAKRKQAESTDAPKPKVDMADLAKFASALDGSTQRVASTMRAPEVERITPQRSTEIIENLVPRRLEFYRQPIVEESVPEKPARQAPRFGGTAGDLLAARMRRAEKAGDKLQAIYGSVSPQDVLVAVRAVMAQNDEAARVVLQESEIEFVDLPDVQGAEAGRIKHIGDFTVEISVRGAESPVRRVVRVLPQEGRSHAAEAGDSL